MELFIGILCAAAALLLAWPLLQPERNRSGLVYDSAAPPGAGRPDARTAPSPLMVHLQGLGERAVDEQLLWAGRPWGLQGSTFLRLQILLAGGLGLLVLPQGLGGVLVMVAVAWAGPRLWLRTRVSARHDALRTELPDLCDHWSAAVSAGATPREALVRIAREHPDWVISAELSLMIRYLNASGTLDECLIDTANRTGLPEFKELAETLAEVLHSGTGLAAELHETAARLRVQQAEQMERSNGWLSNLATACNVLVMILSIAPFVVSALYSGFSWFGN